MSKTIDTSPLTAALDAREWRIVASYEDDVAAALEVDGCRASRQDVQLGERRKLLWRRVAVPSDVHEHDGGAEHRDG